MVFAFGIYILYILCIILNLRNVVLYYYIIVITIIIFLCGLLYIVNVKCVSHCFNAECRINEDKCISYHVLLPSPCLFSPQTPKQIPLSCIIYLYNYLTSNLILINKLYVNT